MVTPGLGDYTFCFKEVPQALQGLEIANEVMV